MPLLKYSFIPLMFFVTLAHANETDNVQIGVDVTFLESKKADLWGLSEEEYQRYEFLNEVDKSFSVENATPFEVLGKHASSQEERDGYAAKFAQMYAENQVKALAWSVSVNQAVENAGITVSSMYQSSPILESFLTEQGLDANAVDRITADSSYSSKGVSNRSMAGSRVTLMLSIDCDMGCQNDVKSILSKRKTSEVDGIDIVFSGTKKSPEHKKSITDLAAALGIEPELVRSKAITLNYETVRSIDLRSGRALPLVVDTSGKEVAL